MEDGAKNDSSQDLLQMVDNGLIDEKKIGVEMVSAQ